MKKILYLLIVATFAFSCGVDHSDPFMVAEKFIEYIYVDADFEKAARLCQPEYRAQIMNGYNELKKESPAMLKAMRQFLKGMKFQYEVDMSSVSRYGDDKYIDISFKVYPKRNRLEEETFEVEMVQDGQGKWYVDDSEFNMDL